MFPWSPEFAWDATHVAFFGALYSVLLTVIDDKGEKGTASQQVRVIEAPAPGSSACR